MSGKDLDNNNDDEKKYDNDTGSPTDGNQMKAAEAVDIEKSEHFKKNAGKIYDDIYEVFFARRKEFFSRKFNFYSKFLPKFQPGKEYDRNSVDGELIKSSVIKVYDAQKCIIYPTLFNKQSSNFNNANIQVKGVLFLRLQNELKGYKEKAIFNAEKLKGTENEIFTASNVYFATSTLRTYAEYGKLKTAGRIAIHLAETPGQFWDSLQLVYLINALVDHSCVKSVKVRSVREFGRGDSILIYCAIPAAEAWKILQKDITDVFPPAVREEYPMPFATPLDIGINANIPISFFSGKKVKKDSFTSGLGEISRQALGRAISDDSFATYGLNDSTPRAGTQRIHNIQLFQRHLADLFRENGLFIDAAGALFQPVAPKLK